MNVFRALGLVEVLGSADAIQAVDVMLKTSEVEFQTWHTKWVKTDPPCEIIKTAVISNPSGEAERLVLENRENSRFARAAFEK